MAKGKELNLDEVIAAWQTEHGLNRKRTFATALQGGQGRVHGFPEPTEKSTLKRQSFQFVLLRKRDAWCKFEGVSGENRFELSPVMVT
jgi:hypothetical protein